MKILNFQFEIKKVKALSKQSESKGFTLIELLVVIGILGILASALVAAIDPFEQLRKAADANVKNAAVEYNDAMLRYFVTHNSMPWGTNGDANCISSNATPPTGGTVFLTSANMTPCITALINDGELKAAFTTATSVIGSIVVNGTTNSITSCFLPQSKAQLHDSNTKYNRDGTTNSSCPTTNPGNTTCYWCSL